MYRVCAIGARKARPSHVKRQEKTGKDSGAGVAHNRTGEIAHLRYTHTHTPTNT